VASGGWLGLSGGHGRRGARRYRGVARRCRALPARDRARKGWERWGHGGTGSPPVRGHRQNFTKALRAAGRPPKGGSASQEARGGGVHDRIGALPDGIGLCPLATVLARVVHGGGTVELARRPCGGIVRILRRLSEPPGGRRWPPEGGSASLEAMGEGVHDGIGALSEFYEGSPSRREAWLAARAGSSSEFYEGSPSRRGARRNRDVARRNRALPARDRARKGWARWGHGGIGWPPVRGHRQNFTKALRAAGRPPVASGGWLGLSGHGRRGA